MDKNNLSRVLKKYQLYKSNKTKILKKRILVFRSYSCELLEKTIFVKGIEEEIDTEVSFGVYNQYYQEILTLNENQEDADVFLILINIEDFYKNFLIEILEKNKSEKIINEVVDNFFNLLHLLRSKTKKTIITKTFERPFNTPKFTYNEVNKNGVENIINEINSKILLKAMELDNIYIINSNRIINNIGTENVFDLKMLSIAKNPYTIKYYNCLSDKIINILKNLYYTRKKCIVVDLDNTLWGGVVGEDGYDKVKIGFYEKEIQNQLLYYHKTGVLLAIASKNNEKDGYEVFNKRNEMVLKENDFIVKKINWEHKYINIINISKELNIGLESMIFIDDSKYECDYVKKMIPEIEVVCLDGTKGENLEKVCSLKGIDFLKLTNEDLGKNKIYKENVKREKFSMEFDNIETYLKSLKMNVLVELMSQKNISRVVQLINKTNQFNLTTKRYTEDELQTMENKGFKIFTIAVDDKFGDNGLVGVCICRPINEKIEIDTFLLSCRVLKRNIENKFIEFLIDYSKKDKYSHITGKYIPTKKNILVKDVYESWDFIYNQTKDEWSYDLKKNRKKIEYIDLVYKESLGEK